MESKNLTEKEKQEQAKQAREMQKHYLTQMKKEIARRAIDVEALELRVREMKAVIEIDQLNEEYTKIQMKLTKEREEFEKNMKDELEDKNNK